MIVKASQLVSRAMMTPIFMMSPPHARTVLSSSELRPPTSARLSPPAILAATVPMSSIVHPTTLQSLQSFPMSTASRRRLRNVQFLKTTFLQFFMTTAFPADSSNTRPLNSTSSRFSATKIGSAPFATESLVD